MLRENRLKRGHHLAAVGGGQEVILQSAFVSGVYHDSATEDGGERMDLASGDYVWA